jgi:hypothetical protein
MCLAATTRRQNRFFAETLAGVLTICVRCGGYGDFTTTININVLTDGAAAVPAVSSINIVA